MKEEIPVGMSYTLQPPNQSQIPCYLKSRVKTHTHSLSKFGIHTISDNAALVGYEYFSHFHSNFPIPNSVSLNLSQF